MKLIINIVLGCVIPAKRRERYRKYISNYQLYNIFVFLSASRVLLGLCVYRTVA